MFARFRDKCYLAFVNFRKEILPAAIQAMECFLDTVFNIPMKWEAQESDHIATWAEANLDCTQGGVRLCRKNIVCSLSPKQTDECYTWPPRTATNAKFTLKSTLPNLASKSLWFASTPEELECNLRSIFWCIGIHRYPRPWWKNSLWINLQREGTDMG